MSNWKQANDAVLDALFGTDTKAQKQEKVAGLIAERDQQLDLPSAIAMVIAEAVSTQPQKVGCNCPHCRTPKPVPEP